MEEMASLDGGGPFPLRAATAAAKSLQSCPTLSDPMNCSLPGSPIRGILQARTLEWVAISFSKVYVNVLYSTEINSFNWEKEA